MHKRTITALAAAAALWGCATPITPRYSVNTDNVLAIRKLGVTGISVGTIEEPAKDDTHCRGIGLVRTVDGDTHAQYIAKALADELKVAGAYAPPPGRVALSGKLLDINASSGLGTSKGIWAMTLELRSTNGASMTVSNAYNFRSGFGAPSACENVASAFVPAVQDLIGKAIGSPTFQMLLQ